MTINIIEPDDHWIAEPQIKSFFPRLSLPRGVTVNGQNVRLVPNNDQNMFSIDHRVEINGTPAAWIDVEHKPGWTNGLYPFLSVALFTLNFNSGVHNYPTLSGKIKCFFKNPETSFWLGIKKDYSEAVCMRASEIINAPLVERKEAVGMARPIYVFSFPSVLATHCKALERNIEEYVLNCLNEAGRL